MPRLTQDEAAYARALKSLNPKLKLREIAKMVGTNMRGGEEEAPKRTSIWRILKNKTHTGEAQKPAGRKPRTTKAEDARLPAIVAKLEKKHPDTDVTAKMIKEDWKTAKKVSPATVSRRLRNQKRGWKRPLFKLPLTPERKANRARFGTRNAKKTKVYWKTKAAFMDNKGYAWYTSRKARKVARSMRKRGTYRLRSEGRQYSVPSRKKHRQSSMSVKVLCVVGAGKIRVWRTYKKWGGDAYANMVKRHINRALKLADGTKMDLYRDNDPSGYESRKGKKAEENSKINVKPLPVGSPDVMPLDFTLWDAVDRDMKADEKEWPEDKTETYEEFEARLKKTAMALPSTVIEKACLSMHRRCRELKRTGGEWIKGD